MFWPWLVEIGLVTVRDLGITSAGPIKFKGTPHTVGGLPAPGDYLATFIIMGPLAALADTRARQLAHLTGWAFVLATLLQVIDPSDPLSSQKASEQAYAAGTPAQQASTATQVA